LITNANKKIDFKIKKINKLLKLYYHDKKPLYQITHKCLFNNEHFVVSKKVHCPRNETEYLTIEIEKILKKNNKLISLIDICAGTGCIGISLKKHIKNIELTLVDISKKCIKNIKKNLRINNVNGKTIKMNFFKFIKVNKKKFDVLIMNPPYLEKNELTKPLTKYENSISFNFQNNVINFYKKLFEKINLLTNDHFLIGIEFGYKQKQMILNIIKENKLEIYTKFYRDINNLDRYAIIYK
jgi:release factor glutamine methyltransferase